MSSYEKNNYNLIFESLVFLTNPKKIVEVGILNGFSLESMAKISSEDCDIHAYDLFDGDGRWKDKHASYENVTKKFKAYNNVKIQRGNFYDIHNNYNDESIDILHIDINNNGDIFEFCFNNYFKKISKNGIIILEGGTEKRDNCPWMLKLNCKKIQPVIEQIKKQHEVLVLERYPGLTIIKNEKT
jgi:uncharacterized UPF0146 family protein